MGTPIAGCLVAAGHRLTVNDLRHEATETLRQQGAAVADTPRAVAEASEVVFTSLPGPQQVEPAFGQVHARETVASLIGISPAEISDEAPIQSVSTGLNFAIVPLKSLHTLESLNPDPRKVRAYFGKAPGVNDFYYITRDTQDPVIDIRARGLFVSGEDPATGSASGCAISWLVRSGVVKSGQRIHIEQGVEMKRPSQIFARAEKQGDKVVNVRVGGHAIEVMEGEYSL